MKKLLITSVLICASIISFAQISGSAHDFSGSGWNSTGEICIVCHTPHHGDLTVSDAPLWNHEVTAATYLLYASPTLDAIINQPDASSKLCLSCHDGTVALENFGGVTSGTNIISGTALIGTDLTNHHPVTFVYDAALATADGGLFDPITANSGLGGTIDQDMLFSTLLQCASCHDAHDNVNGNFLVLSNAASALCLTCHNK